MENSSIKYPVGIQTLEKIIDEGYVYIDKTEYVYKLASKGVCYFLSRPRRFGKSLLLSTLRAYFEGRKELFQGKAIDELEKEWLQYPVLYLDLNTGDYQTEDGLARRLDTTLREWEKEYDCPSENTLSLRFENVIKCVREKTGRQVVILVDEYDKPLLQTIGNSELQNAHRTMLKSFYSNLKSCDSLIRFAFITGVTKFSKVSIFSDLNNLDDISLDTAYAGICGITEAELHQNFKPVIAAMAEKNSISYQEMSARLKDQYDGYRFSMEKTEGVYNPFSLINAFNKQELGSYWFQTGTPSFLVELLKQCDYDLRQLQDGDVDGDVLNSIDSMHENPIPVIYQSGYLTIKDYDARFKSFRLGFPNKEVEEGFLKYLLPFYTPKKKNQNYAFVANFIRDLEAGNADQFMQRFQTFFDDADYRIAGDVELYFQNAMYIIFRLMGCFTQVERATSKGRVDVVVQTPEYVYIIEIKLDGSAEEALQQIEEKGYAKPFAMDTRKLTKIGVNFTTKTRGVEKWLLA